MLCLVKTKELVYMRSIDSSFYNSKAWKNIRKSVWIKQSCLCNRCKKPVYVAGISTYIPKEKRLKGIVHHKEYLNNSNVYNLDITLGIDNLEGLCIDCHNKEHKTSSVTRYDVMFDSNGNLVPR